MKKVIAIVSMLFAATTINSSPASAQVNVQVNIGSQPTWGPVGYDYVQFYYFPDYDFYYDIGKAQYIIFRNNVWTYVANIPSRYRFDPYNAYKVVVNQNKPYLFNKTHKKNYAQYKGQGPQQGMIRDSRDNKYYESKGHPNHNEWTGNKGTVSNTANGNNRAQQNSNRQGNGTSRVNNNQDKTVQGGGRGNSPENSNRGARNGR